MQIIFRNAEAGERIVMASEGDTLMHVALANDIIGIPGDCGGQCACGTCHVYVDPAWVERVGRVEPGSTEEIMIFGAPVDARPNSRLACQVNLIAIHDGLIVEIPEGQ
jgi:2Fe-2S ferredoxin